MHLLFPLFFFLAQPFWEMRPPAQWTDPEIDQLRRESPWAQTLRPDTRLVVYLATAAPIQQAESELRLRAKHDPRLLPEPGADYVDYIRENHDKEFVLAITYPSLDRLGDAKENKMLEDESAMIIGRKSFKFVGHFPPTPTDPVLRLVFPRQVQPTDKSVMFRLYLPGVNFPERDVEFRVKELMYQGKLEM